MKESKTNSSIEKGIVTRGTKRKREEMYGKTINSVDDQNQINEKTPHAPEMPQLNGSVKNNANEHCRITMRNRDGSSNSNSKVCSYSY